VKKKTDQSCIKGKKGSRELRADSLPTEKGFCPLEEEQLGEAFVEGD